MTVGLLASPPPVDGRAAELAVVAVSAGLALLVAFFGRTRLPGLAVTVLLALSGAGIGYGAGAFERETAGGILHSSQQGRQWLAAVVILAVLTPLHARVVLGPLGKKA